MSKRVSDKEFLRLDQDIFSMTVLGLFKANRRKYQLSSEKQGQMIQNVIIVIILQFGLGFCIWEFIKESVGDGSLFIDLFNLPD